MLETLIQSGREAQRTGAWDEALASYETALAMLGGGEDPRRGAELLRWIGTVEAQRGQLDAAEARYAASRQAADAAGQRDLVASALVCWSNVDVNRGNLTEAADRLLEARSIAEEIGQELVVAMIDGNLGIIANIQGNISLALLSYRSAAERYRKLGEDRTLALTLMNMGMAHVDLGEWSEAEASFQEAAEVAERSEDRFISGRIELNHAELYLKRRRYDDAKDKVESSLQVFHRLRAKPNIAEAYKFYGILYRETAKPEQSDTHFALSLGLAEACQNRLLQAETQLEWALLHLEEERKQEGILYLNRALQLFRELRAEREVVDIERRLNRLKELYLPAVQGWGAQLTEAKDPYQVGHAQRVADYATRLGRELGMEGEELTWLRVGAFVHDLGNTAVPEEVLRKADVLTENERELMKVHTIMGDNMAKQLGFPEEVRPIIRHHHEQWAGTGYPDNLAGEKIPLSARIVGVVDVFDALTSPRSFREAYSREDALRIMQQDSEKMFDPNVFGVFRDMLTRGDV